MKITKGTTKPLIALPESKEKIKKKEKLSLKDLEELMDMKAPTYTRGRGGAIRRK